MSTTYEKNRHQTSKRGRRHQLQVFLNQTDWTSDEDDIDENSRPSKLAREPSNENLVSSPMRILLPPPVVRQQRSDLLINLLDQALSVA